MQKTRNARAWDLALQRKTEAFDKGLLRALKVDSEAAARVKDDIADLDFDPFVGSQDPAGRYEARRATLRDNKCSVEIWSAAPRGAKTGKPDAVAELALASGHWQFVNFRYPDVNDDLVHVLAKLSEERRKH